MNQANVELQRLLRLLADAAHKIEQDAYISGWHDCRATMIKALNAVPDTEGPPANSAAHDRTHHGGHESSLEAAAEG
ncbi:MAG TPA: hypothetical protein VGF92_11190 [Stellaceae bacterium]|jgi:hypothetical protein